MQNGESWCWGQTPNHEILGGARWGAQEHSCFPEGAFSMSKGKFIMVSAKPRMILMAQRGSSSLYCRKSCIAGVWLLQMISDGDWLGTREHDVCAGESAAWTSMALGGFVSDTRKPHQSPSLPFAKSSGVLKPHKPIFKSALMETWWISVSTPVSTNNAHSDLQSIES